MSAAVFALSIIYRWALVDVVIIAIISIIFLVNRVKTSGAAVAAAAAGRRPDFCSSSPSTPRVDSFLRIRS
jgi:hypothetical protein